MRFMRALVPIVACGLAAASAASAGTLTGTVTYTDKVPNLPAIDMNADPTCAQKHSTPVHVELLVLGEGNTMANVFVQVKNPPASSAPVPSEPAEIDQHGCIYVPHVLGLRAAQRLMFRNTDGVLHNVHGLPAVNREFNLGMPPTVKEQSVSLNKPEPLFKVKCDVHPWMNAYVAVMTHPYFAVTGKDGRFEIDGLPAGSYTVEAWHEKLGTRTATVTVGESGSQTVDFSFQVPK